MGVGKRILGSTRSVSLLLAGAFALIAAGVTILVVLLNRGPDGQGGPTGPLELGGDAPPPVPGDIVDTDSIVRVSRQGRLTFADKKDRERTAGILEWEVLRPVSKGVYTAEGPRAWMYLRDGRVVLLTADRARLYMPSQNDEPESGTFEDRVVIRLFERPEGSTGPGTIDPERVKPSVLLTSSALEFDTRGGQVSVPDRVVISSERIEFIGEGLRIVWNESEERADLIDLARGESIRFHDVPEPSPPAESAPAPSAVPGVAPEGAAAAVGPATPNAPPGREVCYRGVFTDQVRVERHGSRVLADQLDIWARTLDGSLPPGSIAPVRVETRKAIDAEDGAAGTAGADAGDAVPRPADAPPAEPAEAAVPPSLTARGPDDVILTWKGTLVVTPAVGTPLLLEQDNLALKFAGASGGGPGRRLGEAVFEDDAALANVHAGEFVYRATTRRLDIAAGAGSPTVTLSQQDRGSVATSRLEIDLGSGVASIPSSGTIAGFGRTGSPADRQLTWNRSARLEFFAGAEGMTDRLRRALFEGEASARDETSTLHAESIDAEFAEAADRSVLSRVVAAGDPAGDSRARADAGENGRLTADRVEVVFAAPNEGLDDSGEDPPPKELVATGRVEGTQKGSTLRAGTMHADLARVVSAESAESELVATFVVATEAVTFERDDGTTALADEIRARPGEQVADLFATEGRIAQIGKDGGAIRGTQIRLDGSKSDLFVYGAGGFWQESDAALVAAGEAPAKRLTATWTRSMLYNDRTGRLECVGDVRAISTPDLYTVETTSAERVVLGFGPPVEKARRPSAPEGDEGNPLEIDRPLIYAEVFGASYDFDGGDDALIESVRYTTPASQVESSEAGRVPERFMRVVSSRIIADDVAGEIRSPARGRAAFHDARPENSGIGQARGVGSIDGSERGTSIFDWGGSMVYSRKEGVLTLLDTVRMTHRPIGEDAVFVVDCGSMTADVIEATGAGASSAEADGGSGGGVYGSARSMGAKLSRAVARGNVHARSVSPGGANQQKELLADVVEYDAVKRVATASAAGSGVVTLIDPSRPAPMTARLLTWDLAADRIEAGGASPIVAPR